MSTDYQMAVLEHLQRPEQRNEGVRTCIPGVVVEYRPETRMALVRARASLIRIINGEQQSQAIPDSWMPVDHYESGGFIVAAHVETDDRGTIYYSHVALDAWKADGQTHDTYPRFSEADAFFRPGARSPGDPGFATTKGVMVIGAVDGPRITIDRNTQTIEIASVNEVRIVGQARVRIESEGDGYFQGRWIDPLGGDI